MVGLNCRLRIWRIGEDTPDEVGGAVPKEKLIYQDVRARIEAIAVKMELLQQGIETLRLWKVMVTPQTLVVQERDEIELTAPVGHKLLGVRLRVITVQEDSLHPRDGRGHIELAVSRVYKGRTLA